MIYETLRAFHQANQMVGYSRWKDGDGKLFGHVVCLTRKEVRFGSIDPIGKPDGEETVLLSSLYSVDTSPEYVKRLELFATFNPPARDTKGQFTTSRPVIAMRHREAASTGECVFLTLMGDTPRAYRVVSVTRTHCQLEEFGDNPSVAVNTLVVHLSQVQRMRWRSSTDQAVTGVWAMAELPYA